MFVLLPKSCNIAAPLLNVAVQLSHPQRHKYAAEPSPDNYAAATMLGLLGNIKSTLMEVRHVKQAQK